MAPEVVLGSSKYDGKVRGLVLLCCCPGPSLVVRLFCAGVSGAYKVPRLQVCQAQGWVTGGALQSWPLSFGIVPGSSTCDNK